MIPQARLVDGGYVGGGGRGGCNVHLNICYMAVVLMVDPSIPTRSGRRTEGVHIFRVIVFWLAEGTLNSGATQ